MNESQGISGHIDWVHFDANGCFVEQGEIHNTICNVLGNSLADVLSSSGASVYLPHVEAMAVGIGTGGGVTSTALTSKRIHDTTSGTSWQSYRGTPPSTASVGQAGFRTTFKCDAALGLAIVEAGLFTQPSSTSSMYTYTSALAVTLALNETLQITWTINCYK